MRRVHAAGALFGALWAGVLTAHARDARACGGCFTPTPPPNETQTVSVITDEKMILSVSMDQTTLYDEIQYSGSPSSFAWVLPIKGTVTVGLSADILFETIDQLTATQITSPPTNCPPPPTCNSRGGGGCASSSGAATTAGFAEPSGDVFDGGIVTVTAQKQVGPYESVQLHSNDGSALNDWLTSHGYDIPSSTKPVIDDYVKDGFDFLALKLVPGEGVQSMQPVRVTTQGAAPTLPLHMVAIGTGATTGITIWVVADGRWAPTNFPTFTITGADLTWDWAEQSSNYESVRLAKEASFHGGGWQIESSLELNQESIEQSLLYSLPGDTTGASGGYSPLPAATAGDAGTDAGDDAGSSDDTDGGEAQTDAANADLAVLFEGIAGSNVRITRMRSDIAKSALTTDMILEATKDQSELTNQYTVTAETGEPECPIYDPNTCQQTGTEPRSQAQAAASSGCSTTRPRDGSGTTVAVLVALGGVALVRSRRRRRA